MTTATSNPPVIQGDALDFYLSRGYYRMQQDLFTCRFLPIDGGFYTVHWLRLRLATVQYGPEQRRRLRLNQQFAVRIQPFQLTEELEDLYTRYRSSITFEAPATVEEFLLDGATHSIFTTQVLEIRDGEQLIAAGIFDNGARSAAGIMNFYDPDYRRYGLGKYLLLLEIEHTRHQGGAYFYPGYLTHHYPKFDYKLSACMAATEVFDCVTGQWLPFSWEVVEAHSAGLMADWERELLNNSQPE